MPQGADRSLGLPLLVGFGVACAGGPAALAALYLPQLTANGPALAETAVGAVLFLAPVLVWAGYARSIASDGGLYAFARAAAGRRWALLQGALWAFAYFLYLPYTIDSMVFALAPAVWRGSPPAGLRIAEVALPALLVVLVLAAERAAIIGLAVSGAVQWAVVVALGARLLWGPGAGAAAALAAPGAFVPAAGLVGAAQASLLFVCLSLLLFLGGEARGGPRALARALVWAYVLAAVAAVAAAVVGRGGHPALGALPGMALTQTRLGHAAAVVLGALAIVSTGGLVVAEYLALARLGHAVFGITVRRAAAYVGAAFIAADAFSLLSPQGFYSATLPPSLIALYLAQLPVFAAYPWWVRHAGRPAGWAAVLAAVACAWAVWGAHGALLAAGLP